MSRHMFYNISPATAAARPPMAPILMIVGIAPPVEPVEEGRAEPLALGLLPEPVVELEEVKLPPAGEVGDPADSFLAAAAAR